MTTITVKTQTELDAALKNTANTTVYVASEAGNWLEIKEAPSCIELIIQDSATVHAWGSATVHALGSATVRAGGSATVRAWDRATVYAWDSATVRAWDRATVYAWDSATVRAGDSATVHALGSATVYAWDSATVRAGGSATVRAKNAVSVALYHRASAEVAALVSVHLHGKTVKAQGGQQIIVPAIHTVQDWVDYHSVEKRDDQLVVFKAVRNNLKSSHGALYEIGSQVVAADWIAKDSCGNGLHFSASVQEARRYDTKATRFLKCLIPIAEAIVIGQGETSVDKVKARTCLVLEEVDEDGEPLPVAEEPPKKPRKTKSAKAGRLP